jgi:hypothetical protein
MEDCFVPECHEEHCFIAMTNECPLDGTDDLRLLENNLVLFQDHPDDHE